MDSNFVSIEKENIGTLRFPNSEVLNNSQDIFQRNSDLNRAMALGNLEHSKIKIYFEDNASKKVVETTVWAVSDNSVVLKKGIEMQINRIYKSF